MDGMTLIIGALVLTHALILLTVSRYFLSAQKRLLRTNDDLTSQIVALKNPYAAQMFAQMQQAQANYGGTSTHSGPVSEDLYGPEGEDPSL